MSKAPRAPLVHLATHDRAHVTPRELAEYLDCNPRTILRMIHQQAIHAYRVGRNWRIPIEEARLVFPDASRDTAVPPRHSALYSTKPGAQTEH